jgi:hypothetical protein
MSRYTLEVIAPHVEDELASALEAIATIHGGAVVESAASGAHCGLPAQHAEEARGRAGGVRPSVSAAPVIHSVLL